jgi:protein-S-isoprenylcysteine O-methyltransferase Ste14
VLAGDWCWPQGWIFGGWFLAVCVSTTAWLYRNDPALLAERYRALGTGGQSRRDKMTVYLIVLGYVAWIVLMPLDARRFRWTPRPPLAVEVVGGVLLALSWLLLFRSFTENTFLSPLVRIQPERAHRVVSTGVYRIVRHPMYLGAVLMFVGGPLVTGRGLGAGGQRSAHAVDRRADPRRGGAADTRAGRLRQLSPPRAVSPHPVRLVSSATRGVCYTGALTLV